jgi:hypothetical protein
MQNQCALRTEKVQSFKQRQEYISVATNSYSGRLNSDKLRQKLHHFSILSLQEHSNENDFSTQAEVLCVSAGTMQSKTN